jgi:hypothetical protein
LPREIIKQSVKYQLKGKRSWVLVAHTCDPSYSGGRDQEDCGLKPTRAKEFTRPYLEKIHRRKGLAEWLTV